MSRQTKSDLRLVPIQSCSSPELYNFVKHHCLKATATDGSSLVEINPSSFSIETGSVIMSLKRSGINSMSGVHCAERKCLRKM